MVVAIKKIINRSNTTLNFRNTNDQQSYNLLPSEIISLDSWIPYQGSGQVILEHLQTWRIFDENFTIMAQVAGSINPIFTVSGNTDVCLIMENDGPAFEYH